MVTARKLRARRFSGPRLLTALLSTALLLWVQSAAADPDNNDNSVDVVAVGSDTQPMPADTQPTAADQAVAGNPSGGWGDSVSVALDGACPPEGEAAKQLTLAPGEHPVFKLRPVPFSDSDAQEIGLDELLTLAVENNLGIQ